MKATIEVTIIRKYEVEISGYDDAQEKAKKLHAGAEEHEQSLSTGLYYSDQPKDTKISSDVIFVDMNW